MLKSLKIQNFRMLEDFFIPSLGNVNLIVGENNSGKSTVLEALRIYAKRGNPALLAEIIRSHDENADVFRENAEEQSYQFQHLFTGREYPEEDSCIYIGDGDNSAFLKIYHSYFYDEFEEVEPDFDGAVSRRRKRTKVAKSQLMDFSYDVSQGLNFHIAENNTEGWFEIDRERLLRSSTPYWDRVAKGDPCHYIPTSFISQDSMAELWDKVLFTNFEHYLREALTIIDSDFEDVAFVNFDERRTVNRLAVVKLKGRDKKIPLASMGDGMARVLQLILSIYHAKDGFLLIDEFENGLHWSVQEKIWDMVFELAAELRIQLFVTTHSSDTVKAFASAALNSPQEGSLIRMSKGASNANANKIIASLYDESELEFIATSGIEVR